jgi:hypothetical protein
MNIIDAMAPSLASLKAMDEIDVDNDEEAELIVEIMTKVAYYLLPVHL